MRGEVREARDALARNIRRAVSGPLIDDRPQAVLAGLRGKRTYQRIRQADVQLHKIDLLLGKRRHDPRHLIFGGNGDRKRRPYRVGAVHQGTHAVDPRAEYPSRLDLRTQLQDEGHHVAGIHDGGDACVKQCIQVLLIPENIEPDAVRAAQQMHVHVSKPRQGRLAVRRDVLRARGYPDGGPRPDRLDASTIDHNHALLDRRPAVAVEDSNVTDDQLGAERGQCERQQRGDRAQSSVHGELRTCGDIVLV